MLRLAHILRSHLSLALFFRALLSCIRVDIALLAVVVALGMVWVGGTRRFDIRTIFCGVPAHGVAASRALPMATTLGECTHG